MTPGTYKAKPAAGAKPGTATDARINALTAARSNGWQNLLTGIGKQGQDRRLNTKYTASRILQEPELQDMYRHDGMARRIVDLPAKEMLRAGFVIVGDDADKAQGILEEKHFHKKVSTMIKWARLFGGAAGVMGIEDGQKLDMPVNEKSIKQVEFIHVFDRYRVNWGPQDLYTDPAHPKYNTPRQYQVNPTSGTPFMVHESRVLILDGLEVTDLARQENQGWGDSVIQAAYEQIRALGAIYANSEIITEDFVQSVLGMKNLSDLISMGRESEIQERLNLIDQSRHILNTMLIDAELETFTKQASSIAGLPDLLDRFAACLSAVTGIPITKLFGRSPAGMNATGESDQSNWYDDIRADQEQWLSPAVYERLIRYIFLSKEGGGKEPADWTIQWRDLREPSDKEKVDIRKTQAEVDKAYWDMGVLHEDEIRESRFGGTRYSIETELQAGDPFAADEEADRKASEEDARLAAESGQPPPPPGGRGRKATPAP